MEKVSFIKKPPPDAVQIDVEKEHAEQDFDLIHAMEYSQLYKRNTFLLILYYLLSILSLGILPIFLARWFKDLYIKMTHIKCSSVQEATAILIHAALSHDKTVCYLERKLLMGEEIILFQYRQVNFWYDENLQRFKAINFNMNLPYSKIHEKVSTSSDEQLRQMNQALFGPNLLDVPVSNVVFLLFDEILHPFYVFQIFSIFVWLLDEYYVYAAAIFILATSGAISSLVETRSNLLRLKKMAAHVCKVHRVSNSKVEEISSDELVPGDIIEVHSNFTLPCDLVLISGQCVVNEAMLTGESIPVVKNALPNSDAIYNPEASKIFTLFSGTQVMQARPLSAKTALGLVSKTGFQTAKGKLVLSILYPKPNQFKFYNDSFYFILIMFIGAMIGFFISLRQLIILKVSARDIIVRALDVITICVPPALPIAMTFGTSFAIRRMRQSSIFCISPPRVNVSGKIKVVCFDKTGTLTEENLDVHVAAPCNNAKFDEVVEAKDVASELKVANMNLFNCMASCHSLALIHHELVGDPLEVKIFNSTNFHLQDPVSQDSVVNQTIVASSETSIAIMKRFEFLPSLQRMSTICKDLNSSKVYAFVKGSPEKISALCTIDSIPSNYAAVLNDYTHKGYRVIACAYKEVTETTLVDDSAIKREQIECDLNFIGFVVLLNKLKPQTRPIIDKLNSTSIRSVMVTGDNALTAVSVAKACNIIDKSKQVFLSAVETSELSEKSIVWKNVETEEILSNSALFSHHVGQFELAVTGDAFEFIMNDMHDDEAKHNILLHCGIFARMAPNNKMCLVEELIKLDYYVGMVGDGSNDVSALKAAHIGISLSEAEASIAAPFTSQDQSIACVPVVIREGRAALSTSYALFKYMASYSFIQFLAVIILYHVNSNLGDWQFLFVDLAIIFPTIILMGYTQPSDVLTPEKPTGSLISIPFMTSLVCQFCIALAFQLFVFFDIRQQTFYKYLAIHPSGKDNIFCFENAAIFIMNAFQTFTIALTFNITNSFKKPIYTNRIYVLSIVVLFWVLTYFALYPDPLARMVLQILEVPQFYRFRLYVFCLFHMLASILCEYVLLSRLFRKLFKTVNCICRRRKIYVSLLRKEAIKDRTL